jgi:BlaI family transcriptional regulator, penicillinase repressor
VKGPDLTDRELEIMGVLWERDSATVAEVRERMPAELAYTTVLTLMRILELKGHVRRESEGRAHRYYPLVERGAAGRRLVRRLLDTVFGGRPELLLNELAAEEGLDAADLRRLKELVERRLEAEE